MKCEKCGSENVKVLETRYRENYDYKRRRYMCADCGHRFTRYEISEEWFFKLRQLEADMTGNKTWWSLRQDIKDKKAAKKAELDEIRRKANHG